jgi:hypothetical protein
LQLKENSKLLRGPLSGACVLDESEKVSAPMWAPISQSVHIFL